MNNAPIFISYSRADIVFATLLSNKLRLEGFAVWMDIFDLNIGEDWRDRLVNEVQNCGAFILIISPTAKESIWVNRELDKAIETKKPIFPLLLSGEKWKKISNIQYEDVRGDKLPTASFYKLLAQHSFRKMAAPNRDWTLEDWLASVGATNDRFHERYRELVGDALSESDFSQWQKTGIPEKAAINVVKVLNAFAADNPSKPLRCDTLHDDSIIFLSSRACEDEFDALTPQDYAAICGEPYDAVWTRLTEAHALMKQGMFATASRRFSSLIYDDLANFYSIFSAGKWELFADEDKPSLVQACIILGQFYTLDWRWKHWQAFAAVVSARLAELPPRHKRLFRCFEILSNINADAKTLERNLSELHRHLDASESAFERGLENFLIGYINRQLRQQKDAIKYVTIAVADFGAADDALLLFVVRGYHAAAYYYFHDKVPEYAHEGIRLYEAIAGDIQAGGYEFQPMTVDYDLGWIHAEIQQWDKAETYFLRAKKDAERFQLSYRENQAVYGLGFVYVSTGKTRDTRIALQNAADYFQGKADPARNVLRYSGNLSDIMYRVIAQLLAKNYGISASSPDDKKIQKAAEQAEIGAETNVPLQEYHATRQQRVSARQQKKWLRFIVLSVRELTQRIRLDKF